jgi:hypothetical protein
MKIPHGTVTLLVIGIGLGVLYGLNRLNGAIAVTEQSTTSGSKNVIAARNSFQKKIVSIQRTTKKLVDSANVLKAREDSLKIRLRSTAERVAEAQDAHLRAVLADTIKKVVVALSATNENRCNAVIHAVTVCETGQRIMQQRIDTLEYQLKAQIKVSQCKIWFANCPSRETMFIIGGVLGATAVIVIHHR